MPRATYTGPLGAVDVPLVGLRFTTGEAVEVSGPVAELLATNPEFEITGEEA